jgi:hypothetical protein
LAIIVLVGATALPAMAQTATTGVIEGRVTDEAGRPVRDAVITATATRAPLVATTDAEGRYVFPSVSPGDYNVRVEAKGYGSVVMKIAVNINSRARGDFKLAPGKVEEVTVSAEAPVVDTKTVTTGGTFTVDKYVDYLPIQRNYAQTFTLAPGVESGGGTGRGNYSISGSSGLENSYLVDGVNITNTGYGGLGSYNGVYGSLGTGVTYDFLEEIQVKTGAIDAEFGQATGGVINTVVKSGTNSFSGAVTGYWAPAELEAEYKNVSLAGGAINTVDAENLDVGLSAGGPILKDKLFFFGAYNPVNSSTDFLAERVELMPEFSSMFPTTDPATVYPSIALGAAHRTRHSDNWAAKFTWYVNPNHRIELSGFGDPSSGALGSQRSGALRYLDYAKGGGQSSIEYGGNNYSLKYDAVFTPKFFMQFQAARHDAKFTEESFVNQNLLTDQRQLRCFLGVGACPTGVTAPSAALSRWGGVGYISQQTDKNDQYKVSATWIFGSNELKAGVQYDDVEYTDEQVYSGRNQQYLVPLDGDLDTGYSDGATPCAIGTNGFGPYSTGAADCYINLTSNGGANINRRAATDYRVIRNRFNPTPPPTTTKDFALYVQDTWSINPHWVLKLGLRANQQKIAGAGSVTLPYQLYYYDPTNPTAYVITPGQTVYNSREYTFDWAFAPRLGVTYDFTGDGRSKLYMSASRYYERIPNDLAIRALSTEIGMQVYRFRDYDVPNGQPLTPQYVSNPAYPIYWSGLQPTRIENGTKLPYVDEVVLGFQKEVGRDLSLEARAIYRSVGRALEDIQYNSVESIQNWYYGAHYGYPFDPFPGFGSKPFSEYVLANPGENTGPGFPSAVRKYQALELIANKRFSNHWLMYGNLRIAALKGFYEGLFRNDNGQDDPNITSLYDFPDTPIMQGQFIEGRLNTDRPYSAKVYTSYTWDNGITLGSSFNWASGTPRTPLLAHPNYQNGGELPGINPLYFWWSTTPLDDPTTEVPGVVYDCQVPGRECLALGTAAQHAQDPGVLSYFFLGDYTKVKRGELGRLPDIAQVDLSLAWSHRFGRWANFQIAASVFNIFGTREITDMDEYVEYQATIPNADFNRVTAYQSPRSVRLNAKWSF